MAWMRSHSVTLSKKDTDKLCNRELPPVSISDRGKARKGEMPPGVGREGRVGRGQEVVVVSAGAPQRPEQRLPRGRGLDAQAGTPTSVRADLKAPGSAATPWCGGLRGGEVR